MLQHSVFLSYSHGDAAWKNRIVARLEILRQQQALSVWSDEEALRPGDDWKAEILNSLERACAAVLLLSEHFLNSEFIRTVELPRLIERHHHDGLKIIPIMLRDCRLEQECPDLFALQPFPRFGATLSRIKSSRLEETLDLVAAEVGRVLSEAVRPLSSSSEAAVETQGGLPLISGAADGLPGRELELAVLDGVWAERTRNLFSLVGVGGVGKTAVLHHWLKRMAVDRFRGASRVLKISFQDSAARPRGARARGALEKALQWCGESPPFLEADAELGRRLAVRVADQRTLLVVDCLEPFQSPPDSTESRLLDAGLHSLLINLADHNPGLCVLTSRRSLPPFVNAMEMRIEGISDTAGAQLLSSPPFSLRGKPSEFRQASREMFGHPLTIKLFGSYLAEFEQGELARRYRVANLLDAPNYDTLAEQIMARYEQRFGPESAELNALYCLGLFDREASDDEIEQALLSEPPIPHISLAFAQADNWRSLWSQVRARLEAAGLVSEKEERRERVHVHPLVRAYFARRALEQFPESWREANARLFDFHRTRAMEMPDVLGVEDLQSRYDAIRYGCAAGMFDQAFAVFHEQILNRADFAITKRLWDFSGQLSVLTHFLDAANRHPVDTLTPQQQFTVLHQAGHCARVLGNPADARERLLDALSITHQIPLSAESSRAKAHRQLIDACLELGNISEALSYARLGVADAGCDPTSYLRWVNRTKLGNVLHFAGQLGEAERVFAEAEAIFQQLNVGEDQLYGVSAYRYGDFLLSRGFDRDVEERARATLAWCADHHEDPEAGAATQGTMQVLLGQVASRAGRCQDALGHLNLSIKLLVETHTEHWKPRALLARAEAYRLAGQSQQAWIDVEEALEIAELGQMRPYFVDGLIELTRWKIAFKSENAGKFAISTAEEDCEQARSLARQMGYHRCDAALDELLGMTR